MLVTSGDVYFALLGGALGAVYTGLGLAISNRRTRDRLVAAAALIGVGLVAIAAPPLGIIGALLGP